MLKGRTMSNLEIRPARAEEMPEFARQAARQLAMPEAIFAADAGVDDVRLRQWRTSATTYAFWPLQIRLAGRAVKIAGVTQVSTHPAHRRRGYLRAVTRAHFERMHAQGEVAFAGLHPAWVELYQRYGYGVANIRHVYRMEPRHIRFHHPLPVRGRVRELIMPEAFGQLVEVYRRFREDRTGMVHRGRAMWEAGALQEPLRPASAVWFWPMRRVGRCWAPLSIITVAAPGSCA